MVVHLCRSLLPSFTLVVNSDHVGTSDESLLQLSLSSVIIRLLLLLLSLLCVGCTTAECRQSIHSMRVADRLPSPTFTMITVRK